MCEVYTYYVKYETQIVVYSFVEDKIGFVKAGPTPPFLEIPWSAPSEPYNIFGKIIESIIESNNFRCVPSVQTETVTAEFVFRI